MIEGLKCLMPYVMNVEKIVKYHLSLLVENQYIVATVLRNMILRKTQTEDQEETLGENIVTNHKIIQNYWRVLIQN
jgi:hypothetical protein